MQRVDIYPTHRHEGFMMRSGRPFPFGATFVPGGVNFAVFSRHASHCTLVLFEKGATQPLIEIPFPDEFRIGHVFAMIVFGLDYEGIEYGYRFTGPYQPHLGHRFKPDQIVMDPYARAINGRNIWGEKPDPDNDDLYPHRAALVYDDFDWTGDRPLEIPVEDLVIYEMHVRGFTQHPSSGVKHRGTFAAIREKIPYFKELGVNCVELMPIMEFDEFEYDDRTNPDTGEPIYNYWGYSPVGFFAPKAGYAATGKLSMQVDELKALVKMLHKNGIEVFLDVVFNHTAEGDHLGPTLSYRGIDNKTYYMLKPDGSYYNFSGCGNTMNCNNPVVRSMVMDCLRYWAAEYHIDGFRFDLASILGRDAQGNPLANPPLLEAMAYDPILGRCKLIAEAWDAGGLYQVGSFPAYGRWAEWNGRYRDTVRQFLKGDMGKIWDIARSIEGSPDLYGERGPHASINFITCHDGFSLADLFSYNEKHNRANGEENRDGENNNNSWNHGEEGPTNNAEILAIRRQQIKNAILILMLSQGVPTIHMGDEVGHSKQGNNNTYGQDNALSWLNWDQKEENKDIFRFFQQAIAFRKAHPILRQRTYLQHQVHENDTGYPEFSWHGVQTWQPDWSYHSRTLAFMIHDNGSRVKSQNNDFIYVAMNMHWRHHYFALPVLPTGYQWHLFANTGSSSPGEIRPPGQENALKNQTHVLARSRSVIVLVAKKKS